MNENIGKRNRVLGARVMKGLESRNMEAYFVESKEDALTKALELIPEGSSVAWGGSMSVNEIGLKEAVCSGNYNEINREKAADPEEKRKLELASFDCDYYLTSANAITEDGVMVNIDQNANRIAAIGYGPRNVVVIVGMNKVVKTCDDAMTRARNEAAPINVQRFGLDTPCCKTGMCYDCKSPETACCQILITRYSKVKGRIKVILVNEDLGF